MKHRLMIMFLSTAVILIQAGCEQSTPPVPPPNTSAIAFSCGNKAVTDIADEPPYSANYLERWQTHDGCEVRLDYVMSRNGGCIDGVKEILTGWPIGSTHDDHGYRIFIRDPEGKSSPLNARGFDPNANLPPSAEDTGLRQDGAAVWLVPGSDEFAWVGEAGTIERWPVQRSEIACL